MSDFINSDHIQLERYKLMPYYHLKLYSLPLANVQLSTTADIPGFHVNIVFTQFLLESDTDCFL